MIDSISFTASTASGTDPYDFKSKKLLITTEKHEIFIMHLGTAETVLGFCERCGAEVEMLTLDSAVRVSGINGHRIVQQIANNQTHSIETANGHLLLCRKSLIESLTARTRFQD